MTHPTVTLLNWKTSEDFLHFLQFDFDFNLASSSAKRRVMTLLPLAVGESRMSGAIANTVLEEALHAFNRPVMKHLFQLTEKNIHDRAPRWRYLTSVSVESQVNPSVFTIVTGRLRRALLPGAFCAKPSREVWGA